MRRALAVVVLLALAGCTDQPLSDTGARPTPSSQAPSSGPTQPPTPTEQGETLPPAADSLPPVRHRVSLPALMREEPDGGRLRETRVEVETDAYTRSQVTYRSGDVTVSGVLLRPRGRGPFPAVVLAHGYIDPAIYVTGQGLAREQDWLARAGFVVLHTDYRGHAASDPATPLDREARLGYTRDVINAVDSLKKEKYVDPDRVALLGRSMGGGITLNALVAQPGLVRAGVVYASVSSRYLDNLRHFTMPNRPEAAQAVFDRFGTPREEPRFYRDLSSRTFFARITEPVLMHHGTEDESCPFPWARATHRALRAAGIDARLEVYPGEHHAFVPRWEDSIRLTVRFLRRHLGR